MMEKCKYCGAKLDSDGYCSRPCKPGALKKRIAELKKLVEVEKATAESEKEDKTAE